MPLLFRSVAPNGFLFDLLQLREEIRADVFTIGALYGITDQIDVGITIPILNVKLKERVREIGFFFCNTDLSACDDPVVTGQDFRPNSTEETGWATSSCAASTTSSGSRGSGADGWAWPPRST
jgi:hypothetical protein